MVIWLKKFEDFKGIVDKVNLVVFYQEEEVYNSETDTNDLNLNLFVVENNIYGFKFYKLTEDEKSSLFNNFETIEIERLD